MKKGTGMLLFLTAWSITSLAYGSTISGIDFKFEESQSRLEITTDEATSYEKISSTAQDQVVIDIKGAKLPAKFARKTDASQFNSNLSLYSAYQKGEDVRIVLQLKGSGNVNFSQDGNKIVASIESAGSSNNLAPETKSDVPSENSSETPSEPVVQSQESSSETVSEAPSPSTESTSVSVGQNSKNVTADPDGIESFMEAQETKKFVGSKISIQMLNADLQDIFRVIANASEFNIILSDRVSGKMSLDLADVPWDQVLDIVLRTNRLSAERVANILRVLPTEDLQKEKDVEAQAKVSAEIAEPLVSKIFPISYAAPEDIQRILTSYLSRDPRGGNLVRGSIDVDRRSNSLVVRETPTTIEKFKRLIKELDTQTPQVLIEGKFVEVNENYSHEISGSLGANTQNLVDGAFTFLPGNNNYISTFNGGVQPTPLNGAVAVTAPDIASTFAFSPKTGLIPGIPNISAFLKLNESQGKTKTIASPRIVTQNRTAATITQGISSTFLTTGGVGAQGGTTTVNYNLTLNAEPQVTNDGSINLKINFTQNSPTEAPVGTSNSIANTSQKNVNTLVLVESGATIVIGGIYQTQIQESRFGIPLLMDLPILGLLFGAKSKKEFRIELFIFLTPRIINEKESGLRT